MRRVQFTSAAQRDLTEIWEFIAKDNLDAADRVVAAIDDAMRPLAQHPWIVHARTGVSDSRYRFWRVYSYLIAYRASDTELTVVRIVHGARDIRNILNQEVT